jgi:DNA polymerase III alpha subunit (gram-positive type)
MLSDYYWPGCKTVALDVETTGINRTRDRIIQFGIFGTHANGEMLHLTAVVDAESPTGRDPRNLPGVALIDVIKAQPLRNYIKNIYAALQDAIVIMHNAPHDWAFIVGECKRINHPCPCPRELVCTYQWSRRVRVSNELLTLGAICRRVLIPLIVPHNAYHDARATFYLWIVLNNLPIRPHKSMHCKSKYWPPKNFEMMPHYLRYASAFPTMI